MIITEKGNVKYYGINPKDKAEFIEELFKRDLEIVSLEFEGEV